MLVYFHYRKWHELSIEKSFNFSVEEKWRMQMLQMFADKIRMVRERERGRERMFISRRFFLERNLLCVSHVDARATRPDEKRKQNSRTPYS